MKFAAVLYFVGLGYLIRATGTDKKAYALGCELTDRFVRHAARIGADERLRIAMEFNPPLESE